MIGRPAVAIIIIIIIIIIINIIIEADRYFIFIYFRKLQGDYLY